MTCRRGIAKPFWSSTPAFFVVSAFMVALSLALRALIPPYVSPGPHDDALMATLGYHVANGDWLGDWNFLTLTKSPGYPIVIALSRWTFLPVTVFVHIFYLMGALVLSGAIRRILGMTTGLVTFLALSLNPVMFGTEASRVYRNALLAALCVMLIGLCAWLGLGWGASNRRQVLISASFLGFTFGFAAITKLDALLFLAPAAVIVCIGGYLDARYRRLPDERIFSCMAPIAVTALVITATIPVSAVIALNAAKYQAPRLDDSLFGPVAQLQSSWNTIVVSGDLHRYPITGSQRQAAYEVSNAARSLRPYLDASGSTANRIINGCSDAGICETQIAAPSWRVGFWKEMSCAQDQDCSGAGGWTFFSLIDALMLATRTDRTAYYGLASSVADEIQDACADGELVCSSETFQATGVSGLSTSADLKIPGLASTIMPLTLELLRYRAADVTRTAQRSPTASEAHLWQYSLGDLGPLRYSPGVTVSPEISTTTQALRVLYALFTLILLVPAIVGVIVGLYKRSTRGSAVLSIGVMGVIFIQISILSFLEANVGGYALNFSQYIMPSYPLLIVFVIVGTSLIGSMIQQNRKEWSTSRN